MSRAKNAVELQTSLKRSDLMEYLRYALDDLAQISILSAYLVRAAIENLEQEDLQIVELA
jgi:hypothetical protein